MDESTRDPDEREGQPKGDPKEPGEKRAPDDTGEDAACLFCGAAPEGSVLVQGKEGAICSTCVYLLSARLAEQDRDLSVVPVARPKTATGDESLVGDLGEMSVHDYQSRADLAVAYKELGKTHLAVEELFAAMESALLCKDWAFALRMVAEIRKTADGPTVRDRIHEVLAGRVPEA